MAKRTYTSKPVSPEIARENAIGAAKSHVMYAKKDVAAAEGLVERIVKHGPVEADAVGSEITLEMAQRQLEQRRADLACAEAELVALS